MSPMVDFIDIRKVFDTINRDILVKRLEHYGISGVASEWIKSYLSNRKQFVDVDNVYSHYKDLLYSTLENVKTKTFIT